MKKYRVETVEVLRNFYFIRAATEEQAIYTVALALRRGQPEDKEMLNNNFAECDTLIESAVSVKETEETFYDEPPYVQEGA